MTDHVIYYTGKCFYTLEESPGLLGISIVLVSGDEACLFSKKLFELTSPTFIERLMQVFTKLAVYVFNLILLLDNLPRTFYLPLFTLNLLKDGIY